MVRAPEILHISHSMDISLPVGRSQSDGNILQGAPKSAHGMPLEMGQHQHGIIVFDMVAHEILLNLLSLRYGQLHLPLLIQDVHGRDVRPAVELHGVLMRLSSVACALIGRVALHDSAFHPVHRGLHEIRPQEVLVPHLAGVELHRHFSRQLHAHGLIHAYHGLGSDFFGKIDLSFSHRTAPTFLSILSPCPFLSVQDAGPWDRRILCLSLST